MNPLGDLRAVFRVQLLARGLVAAGLAAGLILGMGLITADFGAWWFTVFPWLTSMSTWLKNQSSWDLFVYVFIGVNLLSYAQQLQGILLERHNMKILVDLSQRELLSSPDPTKDAAKRRAMLTARRRVLESLFSADPAVYSLVTISIALLILGHPFSSLMMVAFGGSLAWYYPQMIKRFDVLRATDDPEESEQEESLDSDDAGTLSLLEESKADKKFSPEERKIRREQRKLMSTPDDELSPEDQARKVQIRRDRAQSNLDNAAERIFIMVNRPLVKMKIGWPVVVFAAITVAGVAVLTIGDMARSGALPAQGTLLLVLLVLTGRTCLSVAQKSEDLAFYTSALRAIAASEDGQDKL